jgi:[acyl-carrier-protein] S-malonyltransferase
MNQRIACIFPGQGSQFIGLLSSLAQQYPLVREVFDEVSAAVHYDVWQLSQTGPIEQLNQTAHTQVVMLAADVAVFRVLAQQKPDLSCYFAGHSLGEYAALVCAGALSLSHAAPLVQARGQCMQDTVPLGVGAMAAIVGLTDQQVEQLCQAVSTPQALVSPANYNAIGQVVIAGHTAAVNAAIQEAELLNARLAKIIPVSVPCHCALLTQAAENFSGILAQTVFTPPAHTVISSVDLNEYHDVEQMRRVLAAQLYMPVRWVETVQSLQQRGVELMFECGPGKVLSGLIKRIDKTIDVISIQDPESLAQALVE